MINLLIAFAAAGATWALSTLIFDSIWSGLVPFFIVLIGVYIYLARKTNKELEAIAQRAQEHMANLQNIRSNKQREILMDKAIDTLKEGFALGKKQFLISAQLHSQIGQLYYVQKKYDEAKPHLEKAFFKAWTALAMLACIHYKRKEYDEMEQVFEKAVKHNKKESLLWNLYAWTLWKNKERDKAIEVLARGHEILPDDDRIEGNLDSLRNGRKMKMRGWRELWYQFHLEAPPQPKMRVDRRGLYRGR